MDYLVSTDIQHLLLSVREGSVRTLHREQASGVYRLALTKQVGERLPLCLSARVLYQLTYSVGSWNRILSLFREPLERGTVGGGCIGNRHFQILSE